MLPEPTPGERRIAAAIHVAGIFAPLWVPAIAYAVARSQSRFVAAHAWQEVVEGLLWKALLLVVMISSLIWTATRLVHHIQTGFAEWTWQELLFKLLISITVFVSLFLWNLIQALLQARSALKGKWTRRELRRAAKAPLPS